MRAPNREESVRRSAKRSHRVAVKGDPRLRQASACDLKVPSTWGFIFDISALRLVPPEFKGFDEAIKGVFAAPAKTGAGYWLLRRCATGFRSAPFQPWLAGRAGFIEPAKR